MHNRNQKNNTEAKNKILNESLDPSLWQIFSTFFRIGAFTIGGGYAMISMIEQDMCDKRKWIDTDEFLELVALAQSGPGLIATNIAVFVGTKLRGNKGLLAAVLGSVLPSFFMILAIAMVFTNFKDNEYVKKVFMGFRPAVVALIAAPIIRLVKKMNITWLKSLLPISAIILIVYCHINPAWTIVAAIAGAIIYTFIKLKRNGSIRKN